MTKNRTYILPSLLLFLTTIIAIAVYHHRKKTETLGKVAVKKLRPPKVRIVYSKKFKPSERPKIGYSGDAVNILREIWSSGMQTYEEFVVLLLDRGNRVLGYHHLSKGGVTGTVADTKLIFSVALEALATSIIVAHNHPSGNLKPSKEDIALTGKIAESGRIISIPMLDHIILTKEGHYSFADEGML